MAHNYRVRRVAITGAICRNFLLRNRVTLTAVIVARNVYAPSLVALRANRLALGPKPSRKAARSHRKFLPGKS
jgi:hypothetical protein